MDRLFRDFGLIREKWGEVHFSDRATHGERTMERAIEGSEELNGEDDSWSLFSDQRSTDATKFREYNKSEFTTAPDTDTIERLREELDTECSRREVFKEQYPNSNYAGIICWVQRHLNLRRW